MERDKTEKKKYLKLYYEWMTRGRIPNNGLCNCFKVDDELFNLIDPELGEHESYWGYDGPDLPLIDDLWHSFTPLRQNVVLLMAAMNGEL